MIKRPLEANRELFISLDSTTCPCIKVAWILLFLTFPRFKLRSCLRAIFYSFRIRCTYVCVIRITFRGNLIALLYSLKSRSIAYVGSKRLKQATRIYNVWICHVPIYPRLFSPFLDRPSKREKNVIAIRARELCCGKIHWQIVSWKRNGVFEQPFDDSLFTWYPSIPRFVPINFDINVHSTFSSLIFNIELCFTRSILYKFFSIRYSILEIFSNFQSCYILNVSEIIIFYVYNTRIYLQFPN